MAEKKSRPQKTPPARLQGAARRVEEVDFQEYMKKKSIHRHLEEIDMDDYLKNRPPPEDNS